ncbi:MAG: Tat (twin-arginine translocation) pathway signal sequence [Micrococcus sp.]|nr:Tat (twin-arginine translocation) pathway signal sequence [Micrococcus sp.]
MTAMIATLVRLRWALMLNQWRRSTATLVLTLLGLLYFGGVAVSIGTAALIALPQQDPVVHSTAAILIAAILVLGWSLIAPFVTGVDATLDPRSFVRFPVRRVHLVLGLLIGTLTTIAGGLTLIVALLVALSWRAQPLVAGLGVLGAVLTAVLAVSAAYGLTAVLASMTGRRRVREMVSLILFVPLMLSGIALGQVLDSIDELLEILPSVAAVLAWTPFGSTFAPAAAASQGDWLLAAAHLAVALVWTAAALALWSWGLRRAVEPVAAARSAVSARSAASEQPLRLLGRPATGAVTAIAARCLLYWRKDPRYSATLVVVVLMVAVLWLLPRPEGADLPFLIGLAPLLAWIIGFSISADIAYDHTAFHLHMLAGVRGVDDRAGRALALSLWGVPCVVVFAVVTAGVERRWELLPMVLGVSLGIFGALLGLASLVSARFVYPVPKPGDSPWATPQGAMMRILLVQLGTMLASLVLLLPIIAVVLAAALTDWAIMGWLGPIVCVGWGVLLTWLGVRTGGRWLDRAQPETFAALQRI